MPVPVFCCFWFQKSCSANILGIGRNKLPRSYFSRHVHEVRRRDEGGHRGAVPTPMARVGPLARRQVGSEPRASTDIAPSPIYSPRGVNPKRPSHIFRKHPLPPPPSTLTREGSEALPGTLPERGIITGGLYIAMPASGVMCE